MNWALILTIAFWSIVAVIVVVPLAVSVLIPFFDRQAIAEGKKAVEELGFEYLGRQPARNHYALYYRADGKRYYARYRCLPQGGVEWIKGSPLDIARGPSRKGLAE